MIAARVLVGALVVGSILVGMVAAALVLTRQDWDRG